VTFQVLVATVPGLLTVTVAVKPLAHWLSTCRLAEQRTPLEPEAEAVGVGVAVREAEAVAVGVAVREAEAEAEAVAVGVAVREAEAVAVGVAVREAELDAVGVGVGVLPPTTGKALVTSWTN
jgi:hypothetical protein